VISPLGIDRGRIAGYPEVLLQTQARPLCQNCARIQRFRSIRVIFERKERGHHRETAEGHSKKRKGPQKIQEHPAGSHRAAAKPVRQISDARNEVLGSGDQSLGAWTANMFRSAASNGRAQQQRGYRPVWLEEGPSSFDGGSKIEIPGINDLVLKADVRSHPADGIYTPVTMT